MSSQNRSPDYFIRTFCEPKKNKVHDLTVRRLDGCVLLNGKWWDPGSLRHIGIYEQAQETDRLGKQYTPRFGSNPKGKFTTNRYPGSKRKR